MIQNAGNAANIAPDYFIRPQPQNTNRTFSDAVIPNRFTGWQNNYYTPRGFGLDLNGDGRFDAKKDGFLSFDLNRDGQHSDYEIEQSRNLLKAFSGDFDGNADGRVDYNEFFQGYNNYFQARNMDLDRDGVLSNWELQRAGGSVIQQGGNKARNAADFKEWRTFNLNNLPNGNRLDYLNPWGGTFTSSPNYAVLYNAGNASTGANVGNAGVGGNAVNAGNAGNTGNAGNAGNA